ncbi:DUF5107 domain-containing protein [Chitinophaga sp.]|uniref:DUF5107 domain-containing protein n=1 Tax=Chitinophaga sp. TaxID=1869181 RepID=UPI0031D6F3F5
MEVKAWKETVMLPTYGTGQPEKNPMFLEKRVYQGSSGVVYPNPVIEKILDEKEDRPYNAVFLENEYLKIMLLPELGGRVHMAWDKVRERHFVYYNQVIKPALVGLTGPWISGGIEFNWPQHHRPSTFEAVDCTIRENADGSKTALMNEVELMFRTKGLVEFTLYPGKAYLEIKGHLYNRTALPQTFLWWANPAVKVNDHYQSVFPPDVHAVFDHGKRDVSDFPIAIGTYYKVDYSPGTDISRYRNIPVPTSYMAMHSDYDFIGGYEHDTGAGVLHVANHHISPGKKQWTWGNGDFGKAWDRNLTDEDGPYIEIMTGVYTDNQPDFSWLQPNEEKRFTQYFMPYANTGLVKNATKEAMVNLEEDKGQTVIKAYATARYNAAKIILRSGDKIVFETVTDLAPETPFETKVNVTGADLVLEVQEAGGKTLVRYNSAPQQSDFVAKPATPAPPPQEVESIELLYLHGLHIEQYRHATYSAKDYYEEALRRDEGDARCNNAMGLWYLRRGQFAKAEPYFNRAIARVTLRNPNPADGEAYYHLGNCLMLTDRLQEATAALYKAAWNGAWQSAAFFMLARIHARQHQYAEALELAEQSLLGNYHGHSVRHLKTVLLRKLGQTAAATEFAKQSVAIDPFNYGCHFELQLLANAVAPQPVRVHTYFEYALDYAAAGFYTEAAALLEVPDTTHPMRSYYLGWCYARLGDDTNAAAWFKKAAAAPADGCFPHRLEEIGILQEALRRNPADAKAWYYLGNLWYDKRQYNEAMDAWERSAAADNTFPTVFRNLSLAWFNKRDNAAKALECLRRAFELDVTDARVCMELDQLYRICNIPREERVALLDKYPALVASRDDLFLERIALHNQQAAFETSRRMLAGRKFHPWEGGEGKVVRQFMTCHIGLAQDALVNGQYNEALDILEQCADYPENLGEGKLYGAQENDRHYLLGLALQGAGLQQQAQEAFRLATEGISEPVQAIFYNDPQPDKIFYQGLAWLQLDETDKANAIFERLINFGNAHLNDHIRIDYFAVSLPDLLVFDQELDKRNRVHCLYLKALGHLGLGQYPEANRFFNEGLALDAYHEGILFHQRMIPFMKHQQKTVFP